MSVSSELIDGQIREMRDEISSLNRMIGYIQGIVGKEEEIRKDECKDIPGPDRLLSSLRHIQIALKKGDAL